MGSRGPVPKRSEDRRRRNEPTVPIAAVPGAAAEAPELGLDHIHPLAVSFYEALKDSPEARFFTAAVWQRARVNVQVLSDWLYSEKPSAIMYSAIQDDWKSLLVDAGEQRRLGIEVQAAAVDEDEVASVTLLAEYQSDVG